MNITADAVKQLRERTGAGMMECKKALVETKGDLDAAAELMRKQGLAKADKKATRVAAEGVVVVARSGDHRTAAMVEVNCETDFVAREHDFRGFAHARRRVRAAQRSRPTWPPCRPPGCLPGRASRSAAGPWWPRSARTSACAASRCSSSSDHLGAYVHGTRIGALVALKGGTGELAHDVAMHVAASNPQYLSQAQVPAEVVAKEREILTEQAAAARASHRRSSPRWWRGGCASP